jgi:hypothetical protein
MIVFPVMLYLFLEFSRYLVNSEINYNEFKLSRTLQVIKEKSNLFSRTIALLQNAIGFEEKDEVYAKLLNVETFLIDNSS